MRARRIVCPQRLRVELEDVTLPDPGPGEVLIATERTVVSPGTELAVLQGLENTPQSFPYRPGYSGAGRIIAVGAGVEDLALGDRVVMDHLGHASHALCKVAGWRGQGLTRIPDEVPAAAAAFLPIASMALQGVRKARPELGESALVAGLGLLGLFAVRFLALSGTAPLLALDFDARRRAMARTFGADAAFAPDDAGLRQRVATATGGHGCAVMLEVTGAPQALPQLLPLLAEQGRCVLVGCARGITGGLDAYHDIHKKGAVIIGAHNYIRPARDSQPGYWTTRDDFRVLLDLLRTGRLDVRPLITATVPPDEAPRMYERFLAREPGLLGVVFDWRVA